MNILYASTEATPFAKTGGLADVAGSLPAALAAISCRSAVIMPFYRCVKNMHLRLEPLSIDKFKFLKYNAGNVEHIFVVNDEYYDRDNLYSEPHGDYPDNDLRFSYYSKAIVAFATKSYFKPDVINCNEWQTGLVPVYLKIARSNVKTLFTIHNIGYQGIFKKESLEAIGVPRKFYNVNGMEYYGKISFLKAGIVYSTAVSTVSKKYSEEILTKDFGCGMEGIIAMRLPKVYGILNGVDYGEWNPATDKHITLNYGPETLEKKEECKRDLIKCAGLPETAVSGPLIGVISRLAEQKGIDLIVSSAEEMIRLGANLIILGTGDAKYNSLCKKIAEQYPEHIASFIKFDNTLAHKIEAGCDMFVMPSRYEPCGLNQLYSLKYGTLPIVRATGGLDDTITDLTGDREKGDGIKFPNATKEDVVEAISRAVAFYKDRDFFRVVQKRIMALDFSWNVSALHYKDLYKSL